MKEFLVITLLSACINEPSLRDRTREAWKDVGIYPPLAYSIEIVPKQELTERCHASGLDGCSFIESHRILLREGLSDARKLVVLEHELGHIIRGDSSHLVCLDQPGDDIMCQAGADNGKSPTKRDALFLKGE